MRVAPKARTCRRRFLGKAWIAPRQGDPHDDWGGDYRLCQDHGRGRIENSEKSKSSTNVFFQKELVPIEIATDSNKMDVFLSQKL